MDPTPGPPSALDQGPGLTRAMDEDTPRTFTPLELRTTSPPEQLPASAQSSAAKAASTNSRSRKPVPSPSPSPALMSSASKLPRRDFRLSATSSLTNRASQHSSRPGNSENRSPRSPFPKFSEHEAMRQAQSPTTSRAFFNDKPLPSRPIVSIASSLSPSKDSRSLIDASEAPLKFELNGNRHDWPTLTPHSVSSPMRNSIESVKQLRPSSIPRKVSKLTFSPAAKASPASNFAKGTNGLDLRSSNVSTMTQRSSATSFASAEESAGGIEQVETGSGDVGRKYYLPSLFRAPTTAPSDQTREPVAEGPSGSSFSLRAPSLAAVDDATYAERGPRSLAGGSDDRLQHNRAVTAARKMHNPSPGSFSRPRPSSGATVSRVSSFSRPMAPSERTVYHQKTASRIPIPDSKKATLVDVKPINPSSVVAASDHSPSFGARRLVSPNALAVLDQGTRRRIRREDTNGSAASTASSSTRILTYDEPSLVGRSESDSMISTEGDEVTTPTYQPHPLRYGQHRQITDDRAGLSSEDFQIQRLRKAPPSASPYTDPLPTIVSQATLPVRPDLFPAEDVDTLSAKPNVFSGIAKGLSDLQDSHAKYTEEHNHEGSIAPSDTQYAFKELLRQAKGRDELCGKEGRPGLDSETKSHLIDTLSALEGHGTPPTGQVDNGTLQEMFGHMMRGMNTASKTNTLIANAAAAEKFVANGPTVDDSTPRSSYVKDESLTTFEPPATMDAASSSDGTAEDHIVSKWSASTPPGLDTSEQRKDGGQSIGFPSSSQIPRTAASTVLTDRIMRDSDKVRHNRSPTLGFSTSTRGSNPGVKTEGSVKRARDGLSERGGFARMTPASAPRKYARTPVPAAKGFRKTDDGPRGRGSLHDSLRAKPVPMLGGPKHGAPQQAPRSRSRSRIVFDKINGFFTQKREKKAQESPPPMPILNPSMEANRPNRLADRQPMPPPRDHRTTRSTPTPVANPRESPIPEELANPHESPIPEELRKSSRATHASDKSPASSPDPDFDGTILTFCQKLTDKARAENSPSRRFDLLELARVLFDVLGNANQAQLSAELASRSAKEADFAYQKTKLVFAETVRIASDIIKDTAQD